jgi:hypothetical protein
MNIPRFGICDLKGRWLKSLQFDSDCVTYSWGEADGALAIKSELGARKIAELMTILYIPSVSKEIPPCTPPTS